MLECMDQRSAPIGWTSEKDGQRVDHDRETQQADDDVCDAVIQVRADERERVVLALRVVLGLGAGRSRRGRAEPVGDRAPDGAGRQATDRPELGFGGRGGGGGVRVCEFVWIGRDAVLCGKGRAEEETVRHDGCAEDAHG